jgi:hypothetical protein
MTPPKWLSILIREIHVKNGTEKNIKIKNMVKMPVRKEKDLL